MNRPIAKVDVHKLTAKDLIKHVRLRNNECQPQTAANDLIWIGVCIRAVSGIIDLKLDAKVFPYNSKTIGKYFTDACKMLGIVDLHFHDLRHHATSLLFERGLSIQQVQLVTLHSNWSTLH